MTDSADWLILVPTPFELRKLQALTEFQQLNRCAVECCGFGPVVSAARTATLIHQYPADRIALIGIAGSYSEDLKVGQAYSYQDLACYGIGAGTGDSFQTAQQMGWSQWDSGAGDTIGDRLQLSGTPGLGPTCPGCLVTCTAASSGPEDVARRLKLYPDAVAEDMEAYSVAVACQLAGKSLLVIRGISNVAGNRDHSTWEIDLALQSALSLLVELTS